MKDLFGAVGIGCGAVILYIGIALLTVGAWVQHLFTCIQNEALLLLTVGIIIPPVGVVHGWLIWLGVAG